MNKKRLLSIGWKIALVLIIAFVIVYHLHFAAVQVNSSTIGIGSIAAEVMGTGTLEAVVGVLIEVPVMLMLVKICIRTQKWFRPPAREAAKT